ncbi:Imm26 family immunity protein [Xanthomonas translucens]|uniref:Imm26 family immunity protein n=2 Tax=Xanthomonas campestris pv. translucens TaxID=343 RepID=UPI0009C1662E|nr:Imm26 family immunity protein [Xanthomonas translucens]
MVIKRGKSLLSVGDVFAIPLRGRGYGFGRIIYMDGKWRLAEFFNNFKGDFTYTDDIVESGRILPVHNIVTLAIESGEWPVIRREPDFVAKDIDNLLFYKGLRGSRSFLRVNGDSASYTEENAPPSASSMPQFAEYISDLLWEKFASEQGGGR